MRDVYIQLTNRCNMTCLHCCWDCKSTGIDMSFATFKKTIDTLKPVYVTLGGGEPMLNKHFTKMFNYVKDQEYIKKIAIITNGTFPRKAMPIYRLYLKSTRFDIELSDPYDGFHDPKKVSPNFYNIFKKMDLIWSTEVKHWLTNDGRVRNKNIRKQLDKMGATVLPNKKGENCTCEGIFILPNGIVKKCGCLKSPIVGNILKNDVKKIPWDIYNLTCYKRPKRKISRTTLYGN